MRALQAAPHPLFFALLVLLGAAMHAPPAGAQGESPAFSLVRLPTTTSGELGPARAAQIERVVAEAVQRFGGVEQKTAPKDSPGCDDEDTACLAALAEATGAAYVLGVRAGRFDGVVVVTATVFDAVGKELDKATVRQSGMDTEKDADFALETAIVELLAGALATEPGPPRAAAAPPPPPAPAVALDASMSQNLLLAGGTALGVGVVVAGAGLVPLFVHSSHAGSLNGRRLRYVESGGDPALLQEAAEAQREADAWQGHWNDLGIWVFWGGAVVAVAGAAMLGASFALPTEDASMGGDP
jgi:hypothetical protein